MNWSWSNIGRKESVWVDGAGNPIKVAPVQIHGYGPKGIPYPIAEEAYKEYAAQYGTQQSLERLCERGGFGWEELATLLYERCLRLTR